jgi:hypothetical protein
MMAETAEPPIKSCAPGQRTPKDQIKLRERPSLPESKANGLLRFAQERGLSHQTLLSRAQREDEAEIMRVALDNPERRGAQCDFRLYDSTDANYATSELGKFCRLHHNAEGNYRTSTAFLRYRAGMQLAEIIDSDLVASGIGGRQRGDAEWAGVPDSKALEARKELCQMRRKAAEDILRDIDRRGSLPMGVWAMTTLCFDDRPLPEHLHELGVAGLYALSLHFGIEKPGYHEAARS